MKNKKFYDITNLLKTGATYLMPLGMRTNGKSYQVKETMLKDAYKNGDKFVYLRRWQDDIKQAYVEEYFADMPIDTYTEGQYDSVVAWQGFLYFARMGEDGKPAKGPQIGRYCALNIATRYKSQAFVDYKYIDYEEFITDGVYLADEPTKLQQFAATVARLSDLTIFMIGNTISRACPYFKEWSLKGTLTQKQNTIEIYHMHGEDGAVIDIAVENCAKVERDNNMFFGNAAKQIVSGEWDVKASPRLPDKFEKYDLCLKIDVHFSLMYFRLCLLADSTGQVLLYIYPGSDHKEGRRLITDDFADDLLTTRHLNRANRLEARMLDCWHQNKVCYSDNLTAADFNNINLQYKVFC